ncbi:hypothetical protein [Sphingopyxis flava]|uniref:Uncharacterized protein n=1 Tax=Sphingopyxis flava TaxID=1507287 RepID=A0A1T5ACB2_9SPHN|nr:hypothetical protein [Sphingopyxis flava]SKB32604.1 hypothetical protein SAMN06295937_100393 [Sphingopyxis flava]
MGEYAIVGPALFVMETIPDLAAPVLHRTGERAGAPVDPPEVWIELHLTYVRLDGQRVSGWHEDGTYFSFRPHLINRWKIRRAARAWQRSRAKGAPA